MSPIKEWKMAVNKVTKGRISRGYITFLTKLAFWIINLGDWEIQSEKILKTNKPINKINPNSTLDSEEPGHLALKTSLKTKV